MKDWGLKKWFDRRFRKARKSLPPGPDLELIKIFACARDRDWPDIFVGRREEIGIVEESCRFALRNCRKGNATAGNIVIFSGAPGSGKISLLEHFSKAWQGKSDPLVVSAPCHFPENEARLAGKIGSRVVPEKADNDERGTVKPRQGGLSISSIGELDFLSSTGKSGIKPDFEKLAKWMPRERWDRPVCLVIDEIQNVTPESRNCLNLLHLGEHGLPIVLVGAGLADSVKKIESALAPRLSAINKRTLGALAPDEVQSCLQQMFDLCRIAYDSRELKSLAAGLTKRSEGWPQHMRTEAAALFTELDKTRGRLKAIDRAAVVRAARGFRRNSYLARQSDEMRDRADLVARVLKTMPEGGETRQGMVRRIAEQAKVTGPEPHGLPPGMSPEGFLDHLIHRGIFQLEMTNILSCPIPSLRSWLIAQEEGAKQKTSTTRSKIRSGKRTVRQTSRRTAAAKSAAARKSVRRPKKDRGNER